MPYVGGGRGKVVGVLPANSWGLQLKTLGVIAPCGSIDNKSGMVGPSRSVRVWVKCPMLTHSNSLQIDEILRMSTQIAGNKSKLAAVGIEAWLLLANPIFISTFSHQINGAYLGYQWYATGTLSTHRPKPAEAFRHILVKYAECRCNDTSHTQSRQHLTLHFYRSNAWRSRSVPSIIIYTLVSYVTYLSLIIFKIIPHPMTLLTAFPLHVIILHYI
jgi:hypothetical protein